MDTASKNWRQQKELFQAALDLSTDQRESYLNSAAVDDTIRSSVRQMLRLHDDSKSFLQSPVGDADTDHEDHAVRATRESWGDAVSAIADPYTGHTPGGFQIERLIGCGGMGAVYVARQEMPNRLVAVKILNIGSRLVSRVRRFEHEIAILARLDHPGIAKILAAGVYDFGSGVQPWLAMELIDGTTLNEFLSVTTVNTRERIDILARLCEAVQHAHDRGVVHRDLKPSNILVLNKPRPRNAPDSNLPSVKIVDFGIARMLDDNVGEAALTAEGEIVGTLNYMSPEQFTGIAVDHRCDIFSLGLIGFEMIAGRLAYDRTNCSMMELIRRAQSDSPLRLRQVDSRFDSDLDAIFAMALQPEPKMRFLSAAQMARDLQRYMRGERVLARPPSWLYVSRKFISRHRTLVAGTLATFFSLAIGLVMYARAERQARLESLRFQYEAEKSQAVNDFITNDFMLKLIAASADQPRTPDSARLKSLVAQAASNIDSMFAGRPTIEAAIRNEVGTVYLNLGAFDEAADQYQIAHRLWQAELGDDHRDTLKAVNNLGQTYLRSAKIDQAQPLLRRAYEARRQTLGQQDPATLASMNNLAEAYRQSGRAGQAESLLKELLDLQRARGLEDDKTTLAAMANLGSLLVQEKRLDEAVAMHVEMYQRGSRIYGQDHPMSLHLGMRAAQTLYQTQRLSEAETLTSRLLQRFESTSSADHGSTINARRLLARIYRKSREFDKAREQLLQAETALKQSQRDPELLRKVQAEMSVLARSASE